MNKVLIPAWLVEEPWAADYQKRLPEISFVDRLQMASVKTELSYQDLGFWTAPSGKILAAGLIYDLRPYLQSEENCFLVPKTPAQIRVIRANGELAYFSIVWSEPTSQTQRHVIQRTDTNEGGVFRVDKNLLAIADLEEWRKQTRDDQGLDQFLDQLFATPMIEPDLVRKFTGDCGFVVRAPNGIAAAVLETDSVVSALHFDFLQFHTSGEDGEYNKDWAYRSELEALWAHLLSLKNT